MPEKNNGWYFFCQPAHGLSKGQVFLEFSFAMILVVLLMLGMIRVFLWTGSDLAKRRQAHDDVLVQDCGSATGPSCALRQLRPVFFTSDDIKATVNSNIY